MIFTQAVTLAGNVKRAVKTAMSSVVEILVFADGSSEPSGGGSGIVLNNSGLIVTNYHVIDCTSKANGQMIGINTYLIEKRHSLYFALTHQLGQAFAHPPPRQAGFTLRHQGRAGSDRRGHAEGSSGSFHQGALLPLPGAGRIVHDHPSQELAGRTSGDARG